MDCVNHIGAAATAFCQNCGRALCAACVSAGAAQQSAMGRPVAGQVLCPNCISAWQSYQTPFIPPQPSRPNPATAGALGIIPGVGAMYNGQFFKGLIHVVIFAVLVSITDHYDIFGIFVAAWIFYQAFEAYHTAKARLEGQPLPDPLGLNELGNWLNLNVKFHYQTNTPVTPPPGAGVPPPVPPSGGAAGPADPGYQSPYAGGQYQAPFQGTYQASYQGTYQAPPAPPGYAPAPTPFPWRRPEPIGAIVLIGLGLIFLLGETHIFSFHIFHYAWPLGLIALGAWLMIRRVGDTKGDPQ